MLTATLVGALIFGATGWALAFFMKATRDQTEAERRHAVFALSRLYAGNHVGGCNNRYQRNACGDDTPKGELCAPCYGRRVLISSSPIFPRP